MKVCWITSPISITSKGERPQPKHARHITFTLWKQTFKHFVQQMADSSEIQSKIDAEIQQSKRDQQDSSFLETLVPIPDFFFNIKAEIEPIGGSKWRIRIFGYILYFITHHSVRDVWIFRVLLASRAARELGIYRHLGMAKARLCVQAPPEDHFARSEHGLEFR